MSKRLIALTTGDTSGVGFEVAAKALEVLGPNRKFIYLVFRSPQSETKHFSRIDKKFHRQTFTDVDSAVEYGKNCKEKNLLLDLNLNSSPAQWVIDAAQLCLKKKCAGIVTAPMSKTLIQKTGLKEIGHTDILKKVTRTKNVYMTFLGKQFNVLLVSGHISLEEVPSDVKKHLTRAMKASLKLVKTLPSLQTPIVVLGLNPHAGEKGVISRDDFFIENAIKKFNRLAGRSLFTGPLSPDAAFLEINRKPKTLFLCMYHDQGLIPFKAFHGQKSGVHLSWGLPIVRTSVDHGTAEDIFGQNKASANSMIEAIQAAEQLINAR